MAACLEGPSDTLRKALADGRLVARPRAAAMDKSARSVEDASAATGMGTACTRVVDAGLLEVLRTDIVPRLLRDVPAQPSEAELREHPHRCRFTLVFDREGYSPEFFGQMWRKHRIACITYHKHPGEPWPQEWFTQQTFSMPSGEPLTMSLAERGSRVGTPPHTLWLREVRKLTESGHQVSLIGTAFEVEHTALAAGLFRDGARKTSSAT